MTEQAVRFSLAAGNEAARLFANVEASLHYSQALEELSHLPETVETRGLRVETLLKLVDVSYMTVGVEHTLGQLAEAEELAQALPDQRRLAYVHYWIGVVYGTCNAMRQARAYAERVLMEAREVGDEELVALAVVQLSRVLVNQGDLGPIEELLTPVLPQLERMGNWIELISALSLLGIALVAHGHYAAGLAQAQRAVEHARRAADMKSRTGVMSHLYLSIIYLYGSDPAQMFSASCQVVEGAQPLRDWLLVYWGYGFRAWAESRLGKHEEAMQSMRGAQDASQKLGGHIMGQDVLEAVTAELLLAVGQVEEALAHEQAAIALAKEEVGGIISAGMAQRVWGQALARHGRWEEVEAHLAESRRVLLSGQNVLEAARTQVAWGLLCRERGETASAQEHLEQAAAQFEASGLTRELETVRSYLDHMM